MLGEKRIACDLVAADNALAHLPVLRDLDGTVVTGLWAIIDHLENEHPEHPLLPVDAAERGECLRLFDWTMNNSFVGAGLFRRNSVDGASAGHGMVFAHEIAPLVPPAALRPGAGPAAGVALCGARFLR
jgi:glutathione S-transferase